MDHWSLAFVAAALIGAALWIADAHAFSAFMIGAAVGAAFYRFLEGDD
jgi:hypothetical protein